MKSKPLYEKIEIHLQRERKLKERQTLVTKFGDRANNASISDYKFTPGRKMHI